MRITALIENSPHPKQSALKIVTTAAAWRVSLKRMIGRRSFYTGHCTGDMPVKFHEEVQGNERHRLFTGLVLEFSGI